MAALRWTEDQQNLVANVHDAMRGYASVPMADLRVASRSLIREARFPVRVRIAIMLRCSLQDASGFPSFAFT